MTPRTLHTIIEETRVTETLQTEIAANPRVDEVFEALKWRLARDPECGTLAEHPSGEYRLVFLPSVRPAKSPSLLARYQHDAMAQTVTIDWIKVYPYDDATAVSPDAFDLDGR